jgi:hypothetical protein
VIVMVTCPDLRSMMGKLRADSTEILMVLGILLPPFCRPVERQEAMRPRRPDARGLQIPRMIPNEQGFE